MGWQKFFRQGTVILRRAYLKINLDLRRLWRMQKLYVSVLVWVKFNNDILVLQGFLNVYINTIESGYSLML